MTGPERDDGPPAGQPWRNLYGRRHGKALRKGQRELLDGRLAALAPKGVSRDENPARAPIDLNALFPGAREVWLEIGFGGGEHMVAMAAANPGVGIVGCEAYINGVAMLLAKIERTGLGNVAIHPGDARDLMDVLPDGSVAQVFLLYPDPWPKKRHHKRRFINPQNLDALARIMPPGGLLRLATDIGDYVRHTLEVVGRDGRLTWMADSPVDWRRPWPGWPGTRYEAKAVREGRIPTYLTLKRL